MNRPFKVPGSARLFSDADSPAAAAGVYLANIDGASRGNPGPASYAVVVKDPDGKIALELAKQIGRTTNNVAEYYALLAALDYATNENIAAAQRAEKRFRRLLVRQMQGPLQGQRARNSNRFTSAPRNLPGRFHISRSSMCAAS